MIPGAKLSYDLEINDRNGKTKVPCHVLLQRCSGRVVNGAWFSTAVARQSA